MHRRQAFWRMTWVLEAGAVSWFLVQALRFLLGGIYAHISSADIVLRLGAPDSTTVKAVLPAVAQAEVVVVAVAAVLPLLALILARRPITFAVTAAVVAVGRVFMTVDAPLVGVLGAALTVAGGALYLAALARQQPTRFGIALTVGLLLDQVVRAFGQTMDPTWTEAFLPVQTGLSVFLFALAVLRAALRTDAPAGASRMYAGISLFGGLAFGALLFLECALFGLPNAIARWSGVDYGLVAPWLFAATALPLVPGARDVVRRLLTLVDVQWRGWFWLLLISILVVVGNRFDGIGAAAALIIGQFLIVLAFWWVIRPLGKETRDVTGPGLVLAFVILVILFGADFFTYEYAFVRDFGGGLTRLSGVLRAMRGLGLAVMLAAVAFSSIPLMDTSRRIPWQRGSLRESIAGLVVLFGGAVLVALTAASPAVGEVTGAERLRVATYNIHGGYSLYFDYDLPLIRDTIQRSGADVVLLQEVEGGRLVSYGVDQALWLGRQLGMHVSYFPANESLQGLAVLARVPITLQSGTLLTSQGLQTGVQRVQIRPDEGVLDIYNTWLGLLYARNQNVLSLQEQDQWQQLQEVLGLISVDHPGGVVGRVVLGGTFNNTPDSPLYSQLVEVGFSDPFDGMPAERSATLFRGSPVEARLDYLWLRNVLPTGRLVLDGAQDNGSDHRLAVVELNLAQ